MPNDVLWSKRWNTLKSYIEEQMEDGNDEELDFRKVLYLMEQVEEMKGDE